MAGRYRAGWIATRRELEVVQAVDTPELKAMGKKLEYDRAAGKMRLADRDKTDNTLP